MGVLLSSFFWTYALFMIPAGFLVDRFGIRVTYLAGLGLWSVASTLVGFAENFWQLILLRVLLGLGESIAPVASIAYIERNFAQEEQGYAHRHLHRRGIDGSRDRDVCRGGAADFWAGGCCSSSRDWRARHR